MRYDVPTSAGVFRAVMRAGKLVELHFPNGKQREVGTVAREVAALKHEVEEYLRGGRTDFSIKIDLGSGTAFQRKVWRALLQIPHGKTKSYGEIAGEIGLPRASRAVGAACGQNPIPILVPCHRVVAHNGGLGGFSAGLHWKKRLLALEAKT